MLGVSNFDICSNPSNYTTMTDDALRSLVCFIEVIASVVRVEATGTVDIVKLKEIIKEKGKNSVFRGVDAMHLILWKVRMTVAAWTAQPTSFPAG